MARLSIIAKSTAGFAMTLTTLFTVAQAQAAGDARTACRADYNQFCSSVSPGGGRIVKCLANNADKLSPSCKAAMADAKAARSGAQ